MKCQHIEFPNSSFRKTRPCNTSLSQKIGVSVNRTIIRPNLIYPFSGIKQQLASMYRRPGFEHHLKHWTNRQEFRSDNIKTDIYDGQVWQTLKESDEDSPNFF